MPDVDLTPRRGASLFPLARGAGARLGAGIETAAARLALLLVEHPVASWLAFTALVVAAAGPLLARRLWFDELLTYYFCGLPTWRELWRAVQGGADASPPFYHALLQALIAVFGEGAWQLRLPSLLGFLVMSACLYVFVRRHCSGVAAWCATIAPALTAGSAHSAEARPYGLVLGFTAAALVCWQRSARHPGWSPWLGLAALLVACAAGCQVFGIYALAPLACAEAVHQIHRGRLQALRWLTFAPALVPVAIMMPVLSSILGAAGVDGWDTPRLGSLVSGYRIVASAALAPALGVLCVAALVKADTTRPSTAAWLPLPEAVAGLGFLAIPPLVLVAGLFTGGPFVPRYAIAALVGCGVLAAAAAVLLERRRTSLAAGFLCALVAGFGLQIADRWRRIEPPLDLPEVLTAGRSDLPVVVEGPLDYLPLAYYAPPGLRARLVSLVDPAAAGLYVGVRRGDFSLARLKPFAPSLRIEDPAAFLQRHPHFFVYRGVEPGWVLAKLTDGGARATIVRYRNTQAVFEVRVPHEALTAR